MNMPRKLNIIGTLAIWLALTFSMLATCSMPASAECETANRLNVPRPCCAAHTKTPCCHAMNQGGFSHEKASGHCRAGDCPCDLSPGKNTATLPATTVEVSCPAILVTRLAIFASCLLRRGPLSDAVNPLPQSTPLCTSSPRAPPFQG